MLLQLATDGHEVFEYPVVYDGDLPVQTGVGMGVLFGRSTVRGPARMADAHPRRQSVPVEVPELPFETGETVRGARDIHGARGVKEGDSRAVVSSIF
jgi:hypothetical protein